MSNLLSNIGSTGEDVTATSICECSEQFTAEAGEVSEGGLFSVDFCAERFRTE